MTEAVVDASALVDMLAATTPITRLATRLSDVKLLHAPHVIDAEVVQALRRMLHTGKISLDRATDALQDFRHLRIQRYPMAGLLDRVWSLRANLTAYDAWYAALAETLGYPLITCDEALASCTTHTAKVEHYKVNS